MNVAARFPEQLSYDEIRRGQRIFRRYIGFNGISIAFLLNDVLILYGIRNGLSDPQLALLASFMHLTMPFMLIGKQLIPRYGLSKTWGSAWLMRYVFGSIMILAPFVDRVAGQWAVSGTVLLGAFGFALSRSIGLVANSPLTGEITTSRDRGRYISGNWTRAQLNYLISMSVVVLAMRFFGSVWVYQVLIGFGCLVGMYASTLLMKVPESSAPTHSARTTVKESFKITFGKPRYRRMLAAWSAGMASFVLVIPFSIVLIKNGYGISDHYALFFSLLVLVGGIGAALMNAGIADRVGPRPLLLVYISGFFVVATYWSLAPATFYPVIVGLCFLIAGFCKTGIIVGISHYFLSAVEPKDRVGTAMFVRMFSGAVAGFAGSAGGGSILTLLRQADFVGLPLYQTYFRIILGVLLICIVIMVRLDRLKEWRLRSVLSLLFSMRDLRALYVLNRLEQSEDCHDDLQHVRRLEQIASTLSESTLRSLLDSPRLPVRVHAIHALREIDFGSKTAEALIEEVRQGEFTSAWVAAEVLGEHRFEAAIPVLRASLESADPFLVGKCMVALVRLADQQSYPRILQLFRQADNPRILIHGANALVEMADRRNITELLQRLTGASLPTAALDELLTALATLCGCESEFYRVLREYNRRPAEAEAMLQLPLESLLGEAPPLADIDPARLAAAAAPLLPQRRDDECARLIVEYFSGSSGEMTAARAKLAACLAVILGPIARGDGEAAGYEL
ncbi:MAG: MFS transporter [bacterium]